ncbi:MAG TPA: CbiX/SirB N-terminal domain-containing protein [Jatrophihabitantaceae bacterium]|jgi:sirohydrochlorin ferrochelatase
MTTALVAAVHGTRSTAGLATTRTLIDRVRAVRPDLAVELCFLDVLRPRLADQLEITHGAVVVVPVLLSAGYHVHDDIPATAAAHRDIVVARHLGPHPLITRALLDRLAEVDAGGADSVALVGSPSTRSSAGTDLGAAGADLAGALGRPVHPLTIGDSLADTLARLPGRVAVATYLLSEGYFLDTLRDTAAAAGIATVTEPLGAHAAIAELIVQRYDEAASG